MQQAEATQAPELLGERWRSHTGEARTSLVVKDAFDSRAIAA